MKKETTMETKTKINQKNIPMRGSLLNRLFEGMEGRPAPIVGMGATVMYHTDRAAVTVVFVNEAGTRIETTRDTCKRTDNNGMSECQAYEYTSNMGAGRSSWTLRKDGSWVRAGDPIRGGQRVCLGSRDEYHDYSF